MLYKRKQVIVKAVQFDPTVKPWPSGVYAHDMHMSHGYIMVNGNRTDVMAGDWLVSWEGRVWKVEREAFAELYEELPGAAAALANTTQYPLSASGSAGDGVADWIASRLVADP